MKILLVSHAYPPAPFAGSLRAGNVARAFAERGHTVHVVTLGDAAESIRESAGAGELFVHRVRPHGGPKQLYRWAKSRLRRTAGSARDGASASAPAAVPADAPATNGRETRRPGWKRHVLSLLAVPDDEKGFVAPAVAKARSLGIRQFDLVYTTAPPHSAHLVGLLLRRAPHARWVMEYRDPWNGGVDRSSDVSSRPARWMNRRLESLALRRADEVIAVSEGIRAIVAEQDGGRHDVQVVRNGIDRIRDADDGARAPGPFRILYIGTLYIDRDPRPFLDALGGLQRRRSLAAGQLEVHLVGRCRSFRDVSVEAYATAAGVRHLLRFTDWVPHEEARRLIDDADLLLLFAQAQPAQVPNKLYEYLGSRRPIFALADDDSETAHLLQQLPGHYLLTRFDPAHITERLEEAYERRNTPRDAGEDAELLAGLTTQRQMARLAARLGL